MKEVKDMFAPDPIFAPDPKIPSWIEILEEILKPRKY